MIRKSKGGYSLCGGGGHKPIKVKTKKQALAVNRAIWASKSKRK